MFLLKDSLVPVKYGSELTILSIVTYCKIDVHLSLVNLEKIRLNIGKCM